MIIYNVTVNINDDAHDAWLEWMRHTHIKDVMNTGMFSESRMLRVLNDDIGEGHTYSIQYSCLSIDHLHQYQKLFAPALQAEHNEKFANKFVAFRTLLEIVE